MDAGDFPGRVHWLQSARWPRAGVALLVGRAWSQNVLLGSDMAGCRAAVVRGLLSAHWTVGLGPRGPQGWCQPLVGGAGSQGLWLQGPGDPGASPGTLVSRADPVPFGVQGWVVGQLWTRVLRQHVCWWVGGLCLCLASCLA